MDWAGSWISEKVTLMKVSSHIMRSRFRAVELYFLYYLGAFLEALLSPLYTWIPRSISMQTKERNPGCPLKV